MFRNVGNAISFECVNGIRLLCYINLTGNELSPCELELARYTRITFDGVCNVNIYEVSNDHVLPPRTFPMDCLFHRSKMPRGTGAT